MQCVLALLQTEFVAQHSGFRLLRAAERALIAMIGSTATAAWPMS